MTGLRLIAPDPAPGTPQISARVPINADAGAADGVLKFTQKLDDIAEHEQALKRVTDIATGQSDFQNALDRKRVELDADPDIAGRETKFQQFAQEEHARRAQGMDATTSALFTRAVNPLADSMSMSVRHQARKDTVEQAVVALRAGNDDLVTKSGDARNPNERDALLAQINGNLKQALDTNVLTQAQYEQERKATLVKADQALALKLIRDNPGGTAVQLAKSDFLANLDPVARQVLIDKAGNEVNRRASLAYTQEARAELQARRVQHLTDEEAMKQVEDLDRGGTLTVNQVYDRRNSLTAEHYKQSMALARGGSQVDDINTTSHLLQDLGTRDLKPSILDALGARQITRRTADELLGKNETLLKDDQPASPYRSGKEDITKALAPGALLAGPAADIQKQALVAAHREFDEFALGQGVEKTRADRQGTLARAQDIINRYRLVNYDKIGEAIGVPRFVDKPREQIQQPDIDAAGKKILQELDAGRLSRAEADQQLLKLDQWTAILKDKTAAIALPPGQVK